MATVIKGSTSYTGHTATVSAHTTESFSRAFGEHVFANTQTLKALGAIAWNGKKFMYDIKTTRAIRFDDGIQFSGKFAVTAPTMQALTVGGEVNAAERDDWVGYAYDWKRGLVALAIPEEYVQDNQGAAKLASLLDDELRLGQMTMARDVSRTFLGHTSAPWATIGLNYMVSVTQTTGRNVGARDVAATGWQNWYKSVGSPGGGADHDKPINLRRLLNGMIVTTSNYASVEGPDLLIANPGAYLTVGRLAESLEGLVDTQKVLKKMYDVGVPHMLVDGRAMIYDSDVTVPFGATASTDSIYGVSTQVCGLAFKKQEYFRLEAWEAPFPHASQRMYRSNLFARFTPYITDRRCCGVLHSITANTDATTD